MSSFIGGLTQNSLAAPIAWLSTCLLAGGASTFFSDDVRILWAWWGAFGLTAALGLEAAARFKERQRGAQMLRTVQSRFERELGIETAAEKEALAAIDLVVKRILRDNPSLGFSRASKPADSHHDGNLHDGALDVQLAPAVNRSATESERATFARTAHLIKISPFLFELILNGSLSPQEILIALAPSDGRQIQLLGRLHWCHPLSGGAWVAGGELLSVTAS
jgi:hypothetical protein